MAEDTQLHMEKWQRLLIIVSTLLLLTAFVTVVVRLAEFIHHTLLLFMIAGLLAYAFEPVVEGLRQIIGDFLTRIRRKSTIFSREAAISIVYISLLMVIGLGIYSLSRPLNRQIKVLTDSAQQSGYQSTAASYLGSMDTQLGTLGIHTDLAAYATNPDSIPDSVRQGWTDFEHKALSIVGDVAVSLGESVIVLLISLYLLIYAHEIRDKINAQLPTSLKEHAFVWQEDVNRILGGFVRGQLILALVLGTTAALGCLAFGIRIWLLIGIFVAFASLIPVFGPYLGAIPAILAALLTKTHFENPMAAVIAVGVLFFVINEVGSKIIYPKLVGQAIGLHVVLVLFAIFAGLEIDGIVGVLFAAPLTAILSVTLVHLYRLWQDLPDSLLSVRPQNSSTPTGPSLVNAPTLESDTPPAVLPTPAADKVPTSA
jgi:predicted PurR-regulated permease PerM